MLREDVLQTLRLHFDEVRSHYGVKSLRLFGSVARAEQRSHSDIDLAIVGDVSFRQVVGALAPPQKQLAREINPIVYSEAELSG